MPLSKFRSSTKILPQEHVLLDDFSGGLDLRNHIEHGPSRFLLQARNLDLRDGRALGRTCIRLTTGLPAQPFDLGYYSYIFDRLFLATTGGGKVYTTVDLDNNGTYVDISAGFPADNLHDFVDFNGRLVAVQSNGVYTWNGAAWTLQTAAVKGSMIAAWQNKLWVAGDTANPQRVYFSKAGDYTTWNALDYVDIRDGEDAGAPITALHATQEMDVTGRPSLLAFKRRSMHRINNATNGSYTTMSAYIGTPSQRSVASGEGQTVFVADNGIYATNGATEPVLVSAAIAPIFTNDTTDVTSALVAYNDRRFVFRVLGWDPIAGALASRVWLSWVPATGAWTQETFPGLTSGALSGGCLFTIPGNTGLTGLPKMYAASSASPGSLYKLYDRLQATDAGSAANVVIQTPYLRLAGGTRFRIHRIRADYLPINQGVLTLRVRRDGSTTDSTTRTFTPPVAGSSKLNIADFDRLGDCRDASFIFEFPLGVVSAGNYDTDQHLLGAAELLSATIEFTPTGRN